MLASPSVLRCILRYISKDSSSRQISIKPSLRLRVCTYSDNIQLFCNGLIAQVVRPTLQALKRKRVLAEKSKPGGRNHETRSIACCCCCPRNSGCVVVRPIQPGSCACQCSDRADERCRGRR